MFKPPDGNLVAPVTAPVFVIPEVGIDISTYLAEYKASDPTTIATIGSMVFFLANHGLSSSTEKSAVNTLKMFYPGAPVSIIALCAEPPDNVRTENAQNVRAIRANDGAAVAWLFNLINAAKKKDLTEGNVDGFFAMLGHSGTKASAVASFINKIAPFYPDNVSDSSFRALLADGLWTTYRLNRVSAGAIMFKLIDTFRELGITTEGDSTEVAIVAANDAAWDIELAMAIPSKYKAYAAIYLDVCGTGIDGWWQGNKAVSELPAVRVRGAKVIFKKYLDLKNNTDEIEVQTTVANLAAVSADFF